jgi:hypothetical protein
MSGSTDFTPSGAGQNQEAKADPPGLQPGQQMTISGNNELDSYIHFNDRGKVYHISLQASPGLYDYVIQVDAEGPHGVFSGGGHLEFTDETNDTYHLYIYSSRRETHTVRYNSDKPGIVKVKWHD